MSTARYAKAAESRSSAGSSCSSSERAYPSLWACLRLANVKAWSENGRWYGRDGLMNLLMALNVIVIVYESCMSDYDQWEESHETVLAFECPNPNPNPDPDR